MRKELSFLKTIALANLMKPKRPFKVNFAITYKCNYRCKMCNIWKKPKQNELNLQEIEKIFSKANYLQWISLTGGEPFLRNDVDEIARIINEHCNLFTLNIPTNGSIPSRIYKKTRKICELSIKKTGVTVSLDGPKELHDEIRGVSGAWERSIETFSLLKELENEFRNFKVFFEFTLSPFNLKYFQKTVEDAEKEVKVNASDFHVTFMHTSEHYYANTELQKLCETFKTEAFEELAKLRKMRRKSLSAEKLLSDIYLALINEELNCPLKCCALSCSCFIDPYGNVYPCIVLDDLVGNLRENNYELGRIVLSDRANALREKINKCKLCWTPCEANQTILANIAKASALYLKSLF
jgi:MoaA/NifB/PqqE/SkfB family radical SAM enzyme